MSTDRLFVHPVSIALNRGDQVLEVEAEFLNDTALPLSLSIPFVACSVRLRTSDERLSLADYLAMPQDEDEIPEAPPETDALDDTGSPTPNQREQIEQPQADDGEEDDTYTDTGEPVTYIGFTTHNGLRGDYMLCDRDVEEMVYDYARSHGIGGDGSGYIFVKVRPNESSDGEDTWKFSVRAHDDTHMVGVVRFKFEHGYITSYTIEQPSVEGSEFTYLFLKEPDDIDEQGEPMPVPLQTTEPVDEEDIFFLGLQPAPKELREDVARLFIAMLNHPDPAMPVDQFVTWMREVYFPNVAPNENTRGFVMALNTDQANQIVRQFTNYQRAFRDTQQLRGELLAVFVNSDPGDEDAAPTADAGLDDETEAHAA